jgi:sirohydrochlorin cobaltochelatase
MVLMQTIIVLAMHGTPPRDFPKTELAEFFRLRSRVEEIKMSNLKSLEDRYKLLNDKVKNWPRNRKNDPFHAASQELALRLSEATGHEVIVGYNEFCAPSLDEALESAADKKADKIIVATPMMTRGGEHAENEIPAKIAEFTKLHTQIEIAYAWPFDITQVSHFLAEHISRFA